MDRAPLAHRLVYRLAQGTLRTLTPVLALGSSKFARTLDGRRSAHRELAGWGRKQRDPSRPLAWLHAPSVGEGLQARAVLEALQRRVGDDLQSVFTHFSPSAEDLATSMPAEMASYLPWDTPGPVRRTLDHLDPDVLAFTKTEVWPELVAEAHRRGVPVALVAATVPPAAGRLSPRARRFLGPTWSRISLAAAIAEPDADRLRSLGVPRQAVVVTGDPGIDSAAQRARAADPAEPWLAPFHADPRPTLVAGSTWPSDEAVLLPSLDRVRAQLREGGGATGPESGGGGSWQASDGLRLILAPHEPHGSHVRALLEELRGRGWRAGTLAEVESSGASGLDAVVVDRVGVLAHLYTVGVVAYVGGGFGDDGLHSVLEPAAAGLPVAFGPNHANARAAGELVDEGGAASVAGEEPLSRCLLEWLRNPETRDYAARRSLGYIDAHLGAAARTAVLLEELIRRRRLARGS